LIVGMKPSPFIAGKPGGYFAQHKKRDDQAAYRLPGHARVEQCSALVRR
jgi:hypothetical protein